MTYVLPSLVFVVEQLPPKLLWYFADSDTKLEFAVELGPMWALFDNESPMQLACSGGYVINGLPYDSILITFLDDDLLCALILGLKQRGGRVLRDLSRRRLNQLSLPPLTPQVSLAATTRMMESFSHEVLKEIISAKLVVYSVIKEVGTDEPVGARFEAVDLKHEGFAVVFSATKHVAKCDWKGEAVGNPAPFIKEAARECQALALRGINPRDPVDRRDPLKVAALAALSGSVKRTLKEFGAEGAAG